MEGWGQGRGVGDEGRGKGLIEIGGRDRDSSNFSTRDEVCAGFFWSISGGAIAAQWTRDRGGQK